MIKILQIIKIIKIMAKFLLLSLLVLVLGIYSGCGSDGTGTGGAVGGGAGGGTAGGTRVKAIAANPSEGFYVKISNPPVSNPDGSSWENAFGDLQSAINAAAAKDSTKKTVYVAQGTYKPQGHPNGRTGDRAKHFALKNGVSVIGGYPGLKDDELNAVDPSLTILSGDLGDNDTANMDENKDDNAYHVFYHPNGTNLGDTAKLSNVTITKGNANADSYDNGGGMYNSGSSPSLTNVTFSRNTANNGGGMSNFSNSSPTLKDVTFTGNKATYNGGGMSNWNSSSPALENVRFTGNTASDGGGMSNVSKSNPAFKTVCRFTGNTATTRGGAIYDTNDSNPKNPENAQDGDGNTIKPTADAEASKDNGYYQEGIKDGIRAVKVDDYGFHVRINAEDGGDGLSWEKAYNDLQAAIDAAAKDSTKKTVYVAVGTYKPQGHPNGGTGDRAKHFALKNGVSVVGGYTGKGDTRSTDLSLTILSGDIGIEDNDIDNAYHVFYHPHPVGPNLDYIALNNTAKLSNVTITKGNANADSYDNGGGMFNDGSSPSLTNVIFKDNKATYNGGGMYNLSNSSPSLTNVLFESNTASDGGGMYNNGSSPSLTNVIFKDNKASNGGGMSNIYNSNPTFKTVCTFTGNMATRDDGKGGAIYNYNSNPEDLDNAQDGTGTAIRSITAENGKTNGYYQEGTRVDDNGIHVRIGAKAGGDGSSWENAFGDLQGAIDAAAKDSTKQRVYVAVGTYKPTSRPNSASSETTDRHKHFALKNNVEVIGGYKQGGHGIYILVRLDENTPDADKTILSGDLGTTADTDNAYRVFYHPKSAGLGNTAKLYNVTITKANASIGNGGGMYNDYSSPSLDNVTFKDNTATFGGGGMYNYNSSPSLTNVTFTSNTANNGGGMYNNKSSPTFKTVCRFTGNTATTRGGAIYDTNDSNPKNLANVQDGGGNVLTPKGNAEASKDNGYYKATQ